MKTEISNFCKEYSVVLAPLEQVLRETRDCLNEQVEGDFKLALASLSDIHHRLSSLLAKIRGQQSYLLIFGPLKSGKSTLMNALSGMYVSEVTSLPAYPCLVFVSYGEKHSFTVTRYNARKNSYTESNTVQAVIEEGHIHLAERIRQVENEGGIFDPGVHYPDAIRRVDIELPAKNLRDSGVVLVDTPGLYSRMRFGYDLMTREFRQSAACAVFVVKTDNLFLEQVFAEFNELLGMFSRIFLVVNIDSHKMDLRPDGSLQPSLESQKPEKIIRAFESLAMSAPLRKAAKEGRLRIYPIDLLNAASSYLQRNQPRPPEVAAETAPVERDDLLTSNRQEEEEEDAPSAFYYREVNKPQSPEGPVPTKKKEEIPQTIPTQDERSFEMFVRDLTDYLNSSDYILEFMRDNSGQGKTLCAEIQTAVQTHAFVQLEEARKALQEKLEHVRRHRAILESLTSTDWERSFQKVKRESAEDAAKLSHELRHKISVRMLKALDQWFSSSDSLEQLETKYWNPILRDAAADAAESNRAHITSLLGTQLAGADLLPETIIELDRARVSLPQLQTRVYAGLDNPPNHDSCELAIAADTIPVRRSWVDWLLFRGQDAVRLRLFGSLEKPKAPISPESKRRRLRVEGQEALKRIMNQHLEERVAPMPQAHANSLVCQYVEKFCAIISAELNERTRQADAEQSLVQAQLDHNHRTRSTVEALVKSAQSTSSAIDHLSGQFQYAPSVNGDHSAAPPESKQH